MLYKLLGGMLMDSRIAVDDLTIPSRPVACQYFPSLYTIFLLAPVYGLNFARDTRCETRNQTPRPGATGGGAVAPEGVSLSSFETPGTRLSTPP